MFLTLVNRSGFFITVFITVFNTVFITVFNRLTVKSFPPSNNMGSINNNKKHSCIIISYTAKFSKLYKLSSTALHTYMVPSFIIKVCLVSIRMHISGSSLKENNRASNFYTTPECHNLIDHEVVINASHFKEKKREFQDKLPLKTSKKNNLPDCKTTGRNFVENMVRGIKCFSDFFKDPPA